MEEDDTSIIMGNSHVGIWENTVKVQGAKAPSWE